VSLLPWRVRVTGSEPGVLGGVAVQARTTDRAVCEPPPSDALVVLSDQTQGEVHLLSLDEGTLTLDSSFAAPAGTFGYPYGLAWDGGGLWLGSIEAERLWRVALDGTVLADVDISGWQVQWWAGVQGLAWDGEALWASGTNVTTVTPTQGTIERSAPDGTNLGKFTAATGAETLNIGLGWDGSALWVANTGGSRLVSRVGVTGGTVHNDGVATDLPVLAQWSAPATSQLMGVAWHDGAVWLVSRDDGLLWRCSPTGTVEATYPLPGAIAGRQVTSLTVLAAVP
jgi:hypothetical protein